MKNYSAKDVDEFIVSAPVEAQQKMQELRAVIKSAAPYAEETIAWGTPFYKYNGPLAGFNPVTHYILFGLVTTLSDEDREMFENAGYPTGKKTIQIRFDQAIPKKEIKFLLDKQKNINESKKSKS